MPQTSKLASLTPDPRDPDFELRAAGLVLNMLAEPPEGWGQTVPASEAEADATRTSSRSATSSAFGLLQVVGVVLRALFLLPLAALFRIPTSRRERRA